MPTVGLEYRYPFINVQPWGTTTIEPIAQVIIRPNETYAGKLPNEDAQSMVFDASNLFSVDKFSGYDRVEGGGRANVGVQATTQFDRGGSVNVLFGQSYQLFGMNSFAVADATNTGVDSGLQNTRSDYVARVSYSPNRTYTFSVRSRMDEATLNVNRFEAEGRAAFDRWSVSLLYGNYAAQPQLGYLTRREGLLGSASVKLAANWVVSGSARWDLEANKLNQYIVGAGYVDDCFVLAANYVTSYAYSAGYDTAGPQSRLHAADRPAYHCELVHIGHRRHALLATGPAGDQIRAWRIELVEKPDMTMTTIKPEPHLIRSLIAGCAVALAALTVSASPLRAQSVAVLVNGEPITNYDIEQRTKLNFLTTHKQMPRQEVIDQLIDEKVKIKEGKKYGVDPDVSDVDQSYASMSSRMRITPDQLTKSLESQGIRPDTLKARLKADMVWTSLVRGRFKESLQVGEKDVAAAARKAASKPRPRRSNTRCSRSF